MNKASAQYEMVNAQSGVEDASPHRLVQMLMEGFMRRLAEAKGAIHREDVVAKGEAISKAITITEGLRNSLNKEAGGELAENLEGLYVYMQQRLVAANLHSDEALIDEVAGLMKTVKEGWDGIAPEAT